MKAFTSDELSRMQSNNAGAMFDTCVIQVYSSTLDDYGGSVDTYTDGSAIACGLEMTPANETRRVDMNIERIDGTLRLPIATSVKATDRVKITHRFGVAVTNLVFEVVGSVRRGPSGLQVDLQAINP